MNIHSQFPAAIISAVLLLSSLPSYACNNFAQSTLDKEKTTLSDLTNAKAPIKLYDYRSKHCTPLAPTPTDLDITTYMPNDETTLGICQLFRSKGEDQITALKHTLEFNINEQKS